MTGDSGTNWNDVQYWSTSSGGAGGASVPTSVDVARFDTNSGNCTLEVNSDVSGLKLETGWAGTLDYATKTAIVRAGNAVIDAGTLTMGTNTATFSGSYTQNGGAVTGTSGTLITWVNFKVLGGTFAHNNGEFRTDGSNQTIDLQNDNLNDFFFSTSGGGLMTVVGTVIVEGNVNINIFTRFVSGTMDIRGNVVGTGGSTSGGGQTGIFKFGGTDQTISSTGIIGFSGNIEVACSGTLTISDEVRIGGGWLYTSGTVVYSAGNILDFRGITDTHTIDFGAENTIKELKILQTGTRTLTGTIIVTGKLTVTNARAWNGGTIELQGNIDIGSGNWQGTTAILINGTVTQTITTNTGLGRFTDGTITINKASGELQLLQNLILDGTGQDLTFTNGILDLNGQDLNVADVFTKASGTRLKAKGDETVTVSGSESVDDASIVEFYSSGVAAVMDNITSTYGNLELGDDKTHNVTDTATLTVNGTLSSNAASSATPSVLRSTTPGTEWSLVLNGTSTLADLVDVQDSDASGGLEVSAVGSVGAAQNNTNWNFGSAFTRIIRDVHQDIHQSAFHLPVNA